MKNIIYFNPSDKTLFDFGRFEKSLNQYAKVPADEIETALKTLEEYENLHVSRLSKYSLFGCQLYVWIFRPEGKPLFAITSNLNNDITEITVCSVLEGKVCLTVGIEHGDTGIVQLHGIILHCLIERAKGINFGVQLSV